MRVLVVEDETEAAKGLSERLKNENYNVDSCHTGATALEYLNYAAYDAMLLDLDLPDMDGMQVLADIRTKGMQVPVLLLSAKGDTQTIVEGLDGGADDFLVRPFAFPELLARLRLILRKQVNVRENVYRCDGLEVDTSNRAVFRDGEEIQLSPREYAILEYLIRNQGIVMTRQQIMDNIYNVNDDVSSNVVDVYIRLLRKKIDARYENKLIHTIRGMGYVVKNNK